VKHSFQMHCVLHSGEILWDSVTYNESLTTLSF